MGNGVAPGGLRRQAATGCGRYVYTVRNRATAAWDARAPLHASRKIPLAVVYVLAGMLHSNVSDVLDLELHHERERATVVGSERRRKTAKSSGSACSRAGSNRLSRTTLGPMAS